LNAQQYKKGGHEARPYKKPAKSDDQRARRVVTRVVTLAATTPAIASARA